MSLEGWITRQEAAARAGVHYNTIRAWEAEGLVHSQGVVDGGAKRVYVLAEDVDRVAEERKGEADPDQAELLRLVRRNAELETEVRFLREELQNQRRARSKITDALLGKEIPEELKKLVRSLLDD